MDISFPSVLTFNPSTLKITNGQFNLTWTELSSSRIRIAYPSTALGTGDTIIFTAVPLTNPPIVMLISDVKIRINITTSDSSQMLFYGIISVSSISGSSLANYSNWYEAHDLNNINITPGSEETCIKTKYTINFTNTNYSIPSGSKIKVRFKDELEYASESPTLTDLLNLSPSSIWSRVQGSPSNKNLIIEGGFTSALPPNQTIQFSINYMLNPHQEGSLKNDVIITILDPNEIDIFEDETHLDIEIEGPASYEVFTVTPANTITNSYVNYTFVAQIRECPVDSSHRFILKLPYFVKCSEVDNIEEIIGSRVIGITNRADDTNNIWGYGFDIESGMNKGEMLQFQIECNNPYFTKPDNSYFRLYIQKNNESIYYGKAYVPTMTEVGPFLSLTAEYSTDEPNLVPIITFNVTSAIHPLVLAYFIITASDDLEILEPCNITLIDGDNNEWSGVTCTRIDLTQSFNIYQWHVGTPNFVITLQAIRNPQFSSQQRYFTIATIDDEGNFGEQSTTPNDPVICNILDYIYIYIFISSNYILNIYSIYIYI